MNSLEAKIERFYDNKISLSKEERLAIEREMILFHEDVRNVQSSLGFLIIKCE